jgi:hypothetical protein
MALFPLSQCRCCHPQAGVVALVAMASLSSSMLLPSLLVIKLLLLLSMQRHLCHCCDGNCCSCHDGIVAIVDAQACLCGCWASIIALVACCWAGIVALIVMALLLSMCRVFAVVAIAIDALMTMASLLLSMSRHPYHCQDSVVTQNNGVTTLDPQWQCCPCCDGIVAILKLTLFPLLQWHCCNHWCTGILAVIAMALLP